MSFSKLMASFVIIMIIAAFLGLPQARGQQETEHCEDDKLAVMRLAIRGLEPVLRLRGKYGEVHTIYVDFQSREWTSTRRLMNETVSCVMATGNSFSIKLGLPV